MYECSEVVNEGKSKLVFLIRLQFTFMVYGPALRRSIKPRACLNHIVVVVRDDATRILQTAVNLEVLKFFFIKNIVKFINQCLQFDASLILFGGERRILHAVHLLELVENANRAIVLLFHYALSFLLHELDLLDRLDDVCFFLQSKSESFFNNLYDFTDILDRIKLLVRPFRCVLCRL